MARIYLIRHGETEWSLSGKHTSHTDIPLTTRGEEQAREVGARLRAFPLARALTSPRIRAQKTCALAELERAGEVEADLTEWDYGAYEGRRSVEIRQERPDWNIFRDGCPEGESPPLVSARADRLLESLRAREEDVALFTHGHFGRVLAARWIGLPVAQGQRFLLDTGSLGILSCEQGRAESAVISLWNSR